MYVKLNLQILGFVWSAKKTDDHGIRCEKSFSRLVCEQRHQAFSRMGTAGTQQQTGESGAVAVLRCLQPTKPSTPRGTVGSRVP